MSHTPGPWRVLDFNERGFDRFFGVQMGRSGGFRVEGPDAEANARLIVAAPELLAACKRALEEAGDLRGATRRGDIRAAIAKAEARS